MQPFRLAAIVLMGTGIACAQSNLAPTPLRALDALADTGSSAAPAEPKAQKMLDVDQNVLTVPRMQAAARDQTHGIFFDVIGDPLIDSSREANDFRRHVVDEDAAIDADLVHVLEEGFGRATEFGDLLVVGPLAPHQLQSVGMEHFYRRDMDVAVGDQVRRQL